MHLLALYTSLLIGESRTPRVAYTLIVGQVHTESRMCRPLVDWLRMPITRRANDTPPDVSLGAGPILVSMGFQLVNHRLAKLSANHGAHQVAARLGEMGNNNHLARYDDEGSVSRQVLRHQTGLAECIGT
jgi:hypothetical protein